MRLLIAQNKRYSEALEAMAKHEPCDCGCPTARKPVLMKPYVYFLIATEALAVGADECRDDEQTGQCALAHAKPPNSEADPACCDSAPTSAAEQTRSIGRGHSTWDADRLARKPRKLNPTNRSNAELGKED